MITPKLSSLPVIFVRSFRRSIRLAARALTTTLGANVRTGHDHSRTRSGLRAAVVSIALASTSYAHADCFEEAGAYQHVSPIILRAIAWQESHNRPEAIHMNANGSVDYGIMQINTIHLSTLAHYGIRKGDLMSPCKNIYIAAWQLRRQVLKYGDTWAAVGAYHSATPALRDDYAQKIAAILRRWRVLPPVAESSNPRRSVSNSPNRLTQTSGNAR